MKRMRSFRCLLGSQLVFWLVTCSALAAPDVEKKERQHLDDLCEQGLFDEAVRYCQRKLADSMLDGRWKAFYAIEHSRCLVKQAIATDGPATESLWQAAAGATEDSALKDLSDTRRLLLRTQSALVSLGHAEWLGVRVRASAESRQRREAVEETQRVAKMLEELASQVNSEIRQPPDNRSEDRLRARELRSLVNQVQYHRARSLHNQAELEEPDTPPYMDALNRAAALLKPLTELADDQPLAWESRLDLIEIERMRRDFSQAQRLLNGYLPAQATPEVQLHWRAEAIRLALDQQQLATAIRLADEGHTIGGKSVPELDQALLEVAFAAWREANDQNKPEDAKRWRDQAQTIILRLGKQFGPYRLSEKEGQIAAMITSANGIEDPIVLRQLAEACYQVGNIDLARSAYDRASQVAEGAGRRESACELAFLAATLEHQRKNYDEASNRYHALALKYANCSRAAEAHLLAAHDRLQYLRSIEGASLSPYQALLKEHLRLFPQATSVNEARWRLGRLLEHDHDWIGAIDAYRGIDRNDIKATDAVESTVRAYRRLFSEYRQKHQAIDQTAAEAARYFERLSEDRSGREPSATERLRHFAILAAADLWLEQPDGGSAADRVLTQYLARSDLAPADRQRCEAIRLAAVATQASSDRVRHEADQLRNLSVRNGYECLQRLAWRLEWDDSPRGKAVAQNLLLLLEKFGPRGVASNESKRPDCQYWEALALARSGAGIKAAERLSALIDQPEADPGRIATYARLLSAADDIEGKRAALGIWEKLAQSTRPGSQIWLASRYELVRLHDRLGERAEANRLLRSVEVLCSDFGGEPLRQRFEQLKRQLEKPPQ